MSEYTPQASSTSSEHDSSPPDPVHQLGQAPALPPSTLPDGPSINPQDLLLNVAPYNPPSVVPAGSSSPVSPATQSTQQPRPLDTFTVDESTTPSSPPPHRPASEATSTGASKVPVHIFRVSAAAAVASTSSTRISFAQDETLQMDCRCTFPKGPPQKPRRHWDYSCPSNPNLKTFVCEYCQVPVGRKDNLDRHLKEFHPELGDSEPDSAAQDQS